MEAYLTRGSLAAILLLPVSYTLATLDITH